MCGTLQITVAVNIYKRTVTIMAHTKTQNTKLISKQMLLLHVPKHLIQIKIFALGYKKCFYRFQINYRTIIQVCKE